MQQGGATQQFAAVPLNLTSYDYGDESNTANYLISGKWSEAAANEAKKFHKIHRVNPDDLTDFDSYNFDKSAKYFHFCQNESIDGVELDQKFMKSLFAKIKQETPGAIITADMSSSIASRDLTEIWQDFGVIYAGAQKKSGDEWSHFCVYKR